MYIEPVMPWNLGRDYPRWTETLRDQTRVVIRPLARTDDARERAFIESLSAQSLRFRFLGQVRHPSIELIRQLTDIDYDHDIAFAAVVPDDADEKILGVARYNASPDGSSCECAVTVRDDWHRRGLGTVLMRHLIEVAKARGILFMVSIDSAENTEMADLARFLGFTRHVDAEDASQVVHRLLLQP
ncbi:MAG: GNAT family N-acetyltransferase [Arenimonas sp.]